MARGRKAAHGEALTSATKKISFPAYSGMSDTLDQVAYQIGMTRSDMLRRVSAKIIVEHAGDALKRLPAADRDRIKHLAQLPSV